MPSRSFSNHCGHLQPLSPSLRNRYSLPSADVPVAWDGNFCSSRSGTSGELAIQDVLGDSIINHSSKKGLIDWLIARVSEWLTDWQTNRRLTNWLTDWLNFEILKFSLKEETRLWEITTEFVAFIPQRPVLKSIVLAEFSYIEIAPFVRYNQFFLLCLFLMYCFRIFNHTWVLLQYKMSSASMQKEFFSNIILLTFLNVVFFCVKKNKTLSETQKCFRNGVHLVDWSFE